MSFNGQTMQIGLMIGEIRSDTIAIRAELKEIKATHRQDVRELRAGQLVLTRKLMGLDGSTRGSSAFWAGQGEIWIMKIATLAIYAVAALILQQTPQGMAFLSAFVVVLKKMVETSP